MEISNSTLIEIYKEFNEKMLNCLLFEKMEEWYPEQKEEYFQQWRRNYAAYRALEKVLTLLTGCKMNANEKGVYLAEDYSKYVYLNPSYRGEEVTC